MDIQKFDLHNLRNAGHYQFQTDFDSLVIKYTPLALGIAVAYSVYHPLLQDEGVAMVAITKSATTEQIQDGDKDRDVTLRGLVDQVRSNLNHFNLAVREAARRVMVIVDSYGNLAPKPNDEESGLITNLIADLRTQLGADLVTLAMTEWVDELERLNNVFIALEATRNSEEASRTDLRMKQVRVQVDAAYRTIIERINALIIVNGETPYVEFVKELNARIGRAQYAIAQSKTRAIKADAVVTPA